MLDMSTDTTPDEMAYRSFFADLRGALKAYRTATDSTQEDVARVVGVSRAQISNFENGVSLPREEALEKIIGLLRSPVMLASHEMRNVSELLLSTGVSDETKVFEAIDRIRKIAVLLEHHRSGSTKVK